MSDLKAMLEVIENADAQHSDELLPVVYDALRQLARDLLSSERPNQTLQATALVHEAYLRVAGDAQEQVSWDGRNHFFAAAARAMRRILVENARRKLRLKHGGEFQRVEIEAEQINCAVPDRELVALDEALQELGEEDPDKARLVELRFFAGMTVEEAAEVLGIAPITAKRHWRYVKARLHDEIRGETKGAAD